MSLPTTDFVTTDIPKYSAAAGSCCLLVLSLRMCTQVTCKKYERGSIEFEFESCAVFYESYFRSNIRKRKEDGVRRSTWFDLSKEMVDMNCLIHSRLKHIRYLTKYRSYLQVLTVVIHEQNTNI